MQHRLIDKIGIDAAAGTIISQDDKTTT